MEVNKHINFLKRRGLLIKESSVDDGLLDFKVRCGGGDKIFCSLLDLAEDRNIINNRELSQEFIESVSKIFNHLRPSKNKNQSRFDRLIQSILNQNPENAINTFKIISNSLDEINTTKLRKALDNQTDDDKSIEDIIKDIKYKSYSEYENSFIGDHFIKHSTKLFLSLKNEDDNKRFIEYLMTDVPDNVLAEELAKNILNNFKNDIGNLVKADLKCIKDVYDEDGNVIISSNENSNSRGPYVEVKKFDYSSDSYLSEFFAIYKNPVPDDVDKDRYNRVIDFLYQYLKRDGDIILDTIKNNFAGIIYENNRFIPREYIKLYWSNKGQRMDDHRLSIRYKLNTNNFVSYIYNKNEDILVTSNINNNLPYEEKLISLPLTVPNIPEKNVVESVVTDKSGKEWDRYSPQGKMVRTKGGTKELDDDFDWARQYMETIPDDPKVHALIQELGADEVLGQDFEENPYGWYANQPIFMLQNGQEWTVGTETSMGNALYEYWDSFIDDMGLEELGVDLSDYLDVSDYWVSNFCSEEAYYHLDITDEELVSNYGDSDVIEEFRQLEIDLEKEYQEVQEEINGYKEVLDTMERQNQDYIQYGYEEPQHTEEDFETYINKLEELQSRLGEIEDKLEDIPYKIEDYIDTLREETKTDYIDTCEECMQDPIYCLVNEKGLYRDGAEVIESLGLAFDRDGLIEDLSRGGYGSLSSYDGRYYTQTVGGTEYYLVRIN